MKARARPTVIIKHRPSDSLFKLSIQRAGRLSSTNPQYLLRDLTELLSCSFGPIDKEHDNIHEYDVNGKLIGEFIGWKNVDWSHLRDC